MPSCQAVRLHLHVGNSIQSRVTFKFVKLTITIILMSDSQFEGTE